ncbi:phosphomannomutase/phosphoglucomutase [Pseudomonas sp. CFBP 13727]|nr:phosphomannomutase/phosphoglucomutase [Pseudomonas sp. CFBP 13727]
MKGFPRNAKTAEHGQAANARPNAGNQALLLAIAGVLAALLLIWFLVVAPLAGRAFQNAEASAAAPFIAGLDAAIARQAGQAAALAHSPALMAALASQDPAGVAQAANAVPLIDGLQGVRLNLPGQAKVDQQGAAPINFAVLDMLSRAERGVATPPEAYKVNGRWWIYTVAAVQQGPQSPVLGTLLLGFDMQPLVKALALPDAEFGQLRLQQSVLGSPPQLLVEQGSNASATRYPYATSNPNWRLEFSPGPLFQPPFAWSSLGLMMLAAAIAIGCAALAVRLAQRQLYARIEADARQLEQLLDELSGGKAVKAFGLSLAPLNGLAQGLARLSLREGSAQPTDGTATVPAPAADNWTNPIFQDTDMLEVDAAEPDPDPGTLPPALPHGIFRAYDIRGIVGSTLNADTAYWVGRAVGAQSLAMGEANVNVGRDGRLSGPELVQPLIQGLVDAGCHVSDVGLVPTPALYYANHVLTGRSGVMLTGSHNPPDYNGFKVVIAGDTLANEQILALHQRLLHNDLSQGQGSVEQVDILPRYVAQIRDDIVLTRRLKVVVDCGNGAGAVVAPELIQALGCEVIPLFCEVDGHFPNHHPDPSKAANLQALIAKVDESGADLGLAFDGDADRVGVVTNTGRIIHPDRLLMLFARDVLSRNPGADVIYDVKCTRRLGPLIKEHGGRPVMWKTGHSLIKKEMKRTGALVAGEMSGHIFFKERWFGFDDGIYSAARLLEILSRENLSAEEVFAAFADDVSTPELNIPVTEDSKFSLIDALHQSAQWGDAQLTTIDGVRVDYPRGWGLVRASNTTPVLVTRFEAEDAEELERIQGVFRTQLLKVAPDLHLPF